MTIESDTWQKYGCSPAITTAVVADAAMSGLDVFSSSPDTLLLDLDNADSVTRYESMLPLLKANIGAEEVDRWPSKTVGHFHAIVKIDRPIPAAMRLVLQSCLGSDPVREFLAVLLLLQGLDEPSFLFRPKGPTP